MVANTILIIIKEMFWEEKVFTNLVAKDRVSLI